VKAPKTIHFVAELPRNAAGKVSRAAVRGMLVTWPSGLRAGIGL